MTKRRLPQLEGPIKGAAGDVAATAGAHIHAHHFPVMSRQRLDRRPSRRRPQLYGGVVGGGGDVGAAGGVAVEAHPTDHVGVRGDGVLQLALANVPNLDGVVLTSRHQLVAIRAEVHGDDALEKKSQRLLEKPKQNTET